jgi:signal peptidase II
VALDQVSKVLAVRLVLPAGQDGIHVAGGVIFLRYLENTGVAFGLLQGQGPLLTGLALLIVGILIVYYRYLPHQTPELRLSLGLILGGAAGNLVDRLRLGHVIDFIDLTYWPVFNIADASICAGAVILALSILLTDRPASSQPRAMSHEP